MVWVCGGDFTMGCADPRAIDGGGPDAMNDARPLHRISVSAFWIDATEVTNRDFAAFVAATGWVTVAERPLTAEEFPTLPDELRVAGSLVFTPTPEPVELDDFRSWWRFVPGADWRHPTGPDSSIAGRDDYPVVQVAWDDAAAFARWAGKRLPTEAEWEYAARGGIDGGWFAWGDQLRPGGNWRANLWQGTFPVAGGDRAEDGWAGLAPTARFAPNGYGLFDVAGNAWEWCNDWYRDDAYELRAGGDAPVRDPVGPPDSYDPLEPGCAKRVQRGGSFLCNVQWCARYLVGARGKGDPRSASDHVGFRCARTP